MSAHRYWQLGGLANAQNSQPSVAELNLRSTVGGLDLPITGITASNTTSTTTAANAIDKDPATAWMANTYTADLTVDMGSAVDVTEVVIQCNATSNYFVVQTFTLRFADNATGPWTDVQYFSNTTPWVAGEIRVYDVTGAPAPSAATTTTVTLQNLAGALAINLTGLKWAFHDQVTPNLFTAPTAKGAAGTTNASGVFTATITGTALVPGAVGWLYVTDSTGVTTQALKAFCGPATVS